MASMAAARVDGLGGQWRGQRSSMAAARVEGVWGGVKFTWNNVLCSGPGLISNSISTHYTWKRRYKPCASHWASFVCLTSTILCQIPFVCNKCEIFISCNVIAEQIFSFKSKSWDFFLNFLWVVEESHRRHNFTERSSASPHADGKWVFNLGGMVLKCFGGVLAMGLCNKSAPQLLSLELCHHGNSGSMLPT